MVHANEPYRLPYSTPSPQPTGPKPYAEPAQNVPMQQDHATVRKRREALIATARVEQRPLDEWCVELGFRYGSASAYLRRAGVPFKGTREAKAEKMLSLHEAGLDCHAIAKEMGHATAHYAYRRLLELGAKPAYPNGGHNKTIGGKRMSKETPRVVKMLGDLKRGMETADMLAKYGVSRERISQVRAYGVEAGLLPGILEK